MVFKQPSFDKFCKISIMKVSETLSLLTIKIFGCFYFVSRQDESNDQSHIF